jgi:hypothetical protein
MTFRRFWAVALAMAAVLGLAAPAAAQSRQRIYLAPQTVEVQPGKSAILRGACLDEKIVGVPSDKDPITRFSDPDALVIQEFKDGRPTGRVQKYGDILSGKEKEPWIEVVGVPIGTGTNLTVKPVGKPAPGISYKITVEKGMATGREAEPITDDLLKQLKTHQAAIDYIDGEFATWKKVFGDNNGLGQSLTQLAQRDVYWAIAKNREPEDVLDGAKKKVEQFFADLKDKDAVQQYLLVAAFTGKAELNKEQRDYLAKRGITLENLPANDRVARKLAEALANDSLIRSIRAIPDRENGADEVGAVRERIQEVREEIIACQKILKENPDVERLFVNLYKPTIMHVYMLKEQLAILKSPRTVAPSFADGKMVIKAGKKEVDLRQVLSDVNTGKRPPEEYYELNGPDCVINAAGLEPGQIRDLEQTLSEIGRKDPSSAFFGRFALDKEASLKRNKELLDKSDLDVRVGGNTFQRLPVGKLVEAVLQKLDLKLPGGRNVEFHVAHDDKEILDTLTKKAKNKDFKDKHLVLMICNDKTDKETFAKFVELSKAALDNGAASVLMPDRALQPHAMTLIALTVKQQPELMDAMTPRELYILSSLRALEKLQACRQRPPEEQVEALKKEFGGGQELEDLFRKKGDKVIDPKLLDRVEEELKKGWIDFLELVIDNRPARAPLG